ncbi:MAG: hypothetical protein Q4A54_07150 [Parabacteroides sp.]|nr:hypothetical protein [Parabacteroides sp.]
MKEQIRKLLITLKCTYFAFWTTPIWFIALYETDIFTKGVHAGNVQMEYILQSVSILLTIGFIPFALRIFNLNLVKRIKEYPLQRALASYKLWSDIRLSLLFVPATLSFTFYYMTLNTTGLFCGAMAMIASLFCIPSESRIKNELDLPEEINK